MRKPGVYEIPEAPRTTRGRAIVNLIGHHATWQRNLDPPLNSEVEQLAAPVSSWVRTNASSEHISVDIAAAIAAATHGPGQVATLVVPGDCQWESA